MKKSRLHKVLEVLDKINTQNEQIKEIKTKGKNPVKVLDSIRKQDNQR